MGQQLTWNQCLAYQEVCVVGYGHDREGGGSVWEMRETSKPTASLQPVLG